MASDATDRLARHDVDVISHPTDFEVVLVEDFKEQHLVGGNLEMGRAVRLDRHRAENASNFPAATIADVQTLGRGPLCLRMNFENTQVFDFAASDPIEALVNIGNIIVPGVPGGTSRTVFGIIRGGRRDRIGIGL